MRTAEGSAADEVDDLAFLALEASEQGRVRDAGRLAGEALDLAGRATAGVERDRALARALRALGTAQRARGDYGEAGRAFGRALGHARGGFGPASLEIAELENDLGMTCKYLGRFGDAEAAYERARAILERLPNADPEDLAALLHNLGGLAHARGDPASAEPLARRATELRAMALGEHAPATLLDRSAHAAIVFALGRSDEAEARLRDVIPELERALGPDHPEVAVALNNLAAIRQATGALPEAESLYRRVIAIKSSRLGADSPALAIPLNNLGTVLRRLGRLDEAAAAYRRALEVFSGIVGDDHPTLATVRRNLARATGQEDAPAVEDPGASG